MRRRSSISWLSARWVRLRSPISCAIFEAPTISPAADLIGEMASATSTSRPSLRSRRVSCCSIASPRAIRSRMSRTSPRLSGGTMISMRWPMASAAVNPNRRSAARFQPVMVPSSVLVMMASLDDSTTALNRRSRAVNRSLSEAACRCSMSNRRDNSACRATLSTNSTARTKLAAQSP